MNQKDIAMITTVINNSDLHFEHRSWESELLFWEDELNTFDHRLEELVERYTGMELLKKLEHFQNEFNLHRKRINEMREDIEKHEERLAGQSLSGEGNALDVPMVKSHMAFREKIETQREMYAGLKKAFFRFLTEYM